MFSDEIQLANQKGCCHASDFIFFTLFTSALYPVQDQLVVITSRYFFACSMAKLYSDSLSFF
jgi:hypothetical protein